MQTKHIQYERLVRAFHADIYRYAAAKQDPKLAAFWQALKQQEIDIKETLNIPVPDDLADKLLWHTQAQDKAMTDSNRAATIDFAQAKVLVMGEVADTVQSLKAQVQAHLKFY